MSVSPAYRELIKPISPLGKLELAAEILASYGRVRWLLWRTDLPMTLRAVRDGVVPTRRVTDDPLARRYAGVRLGRAVGRTLELLPSDSRCLMRSLVLTNLLARRGISSSLVIGIAPGTNLAAHAWVESDGIPLLSPTDRSRSFDRIVSL